MHRKSLMWLLLIGFLCLAVYGVANISHAITGYYDLRQVIVNETDFTQFFDCEFLTSPTWVGFLKGLFSGAFLDAAYMAFEPHNPLLKVNYSQGMAEMLIGHSFIPYIIGVTVGTGLTIFILGGALAATLKHLERKDYRNES